MYTAILIIPSIENIICSNRIIYYIAIYVIKYCSGICRFLNNGIAISFIPERSAPPH